MFTADQVIQAYQLGLFPMEEPSGEIAWFSPDPRGIIDLDHFHIPKSLKTTLNRNPFELRFDTQFEQVIQACAERDEGTWIGDEILRIFTQLHDRGLAHSVECWQDGALVGGLYGVAIAGAFFGESMFHRATDASKIALVALVDRLRDRGFTLLDTQWITPHLARFGAAEISRTEYLARLDRALSQTHVRFTAD